MLYEITLLVITLGIIFISLILSEKRAEKRVESKVERRYMEIFGADVKDFEHLIQCINQLEFKKIPAPLKNNASIYNQLLQASDAYLAAYMAIDKSKQQIVELSIKNRELVDSYTKVLNLISPAAYDSIREDNDEDMVVKKMVSEIHTSLNSLSKLP